MSDKGICCGKISGDWHSYRCSRKGKMKYDGELFCKTHHPPTIKEKDRIRSEKWESEERAANEKREAPAREIESLRAELAASEKTLKYRTDERDLTSKVLDEAMVQRDADEAKLAASEGRVRALRDEATDLRNAVNPLAYTQDRTMTEREQKRIQKALEDHCLIDRPDSEAKGEKG